MGKSDTWSPALGIKKLLYDPEDPLKLPNLCQINISVAVCCELCSDEHSIHTAPSSISGQTKFANNLCFHIRKWLSYRFAVLTERTFQFFLTVFLQRRWSWKTAWGGKAILTGKRDKTAIDHCSGLACGPPGDRRGFLRVIIIAVHFPLPSSTSCNCFQALQAYSFNCTLGGLES